MLKAVMSNPSDPEQVTVILGLSRENVERLQKDQPILFPMSHLIIPEGTVLEKSRMSIIYAETEADLLRIIVNLGGKVIT